MVGEEKDLSCAFCAFLRQILFLPFCAFLRLKLFSLSLRQREHATRSRELHWRAISDDVHDTGARICALVRATQRWRQSMQWHTACIGEFERPRDVRSSLLGTQVL